jgi:CDP-diacylglycerol--glycerol-3-phosphate 3-phosphatidyltransferase
VANKPKPLISANMVTSARLLVMPVMVWLLYLHPLAGASKNSWWWALVIGSIVSCTDFVDGAIARKYGPTVLGGMLDPLADKVFVALVYLPLMHVGFVPMWAVGLLFVREFMVTSIRSAYEWRGLQLKTSYFGKVKTWVQMQGILILMGVQLLPKTTLLILLIVLAVIPVVGLAFFWFAKKEFSLGMLLGILLGVAVWALFKYPETGQPGITVTMWFVCAVTWMSGFDYLAGAIPRLHKAGGFHRADVIRLLAAVAIPLSAVLVMMHTTVHPLPMLAIVAGELAVGGLDNLLSRHKASASVLSFSVRTLGCSGLLLLALVFESQASILAWSAMTVSVLGVAHEFWTGRKHYLDDSKWDEELVDA